MDCGIHLLKLKTLVAVSSVVGKALDLDDALYTVLRILAEQLSMKRASIVLADSDTGNLRICASYGLTPEEERRGVYRIDEGVTGAIFRDKTAYFIEDVSQEPLFLDKTGARKIEKERVSFLGVPILHQDRPLGVLNVDRLFTNAVPPEEDIEFLSVVATLLAQFVTLDERVRERMRRLEVENASLKNQISKERRGPYIVGKSEAMLHVQQQMERVAPTRATVLLLGESGTGKTLIARIIRDLSDRSEFPFVKVNCASIPENLLESELFGYERGAFTGATASKPGRFEEAHRGTIFLDEVGELPFALQGKLLRVIQDKEMERLGSNRTRSIDVRILAATNRDLEQLVGEGRFREDLFYRLNVFPIRVPSLRERKEDIVTLLTHFLGKICKEYDRRLAFDNQALDVLRDYDWPGNVRQMENFVERLVIMAESEHIDAPLIHRYLVPALQTGQHPRQNAEPQREMQTGDAQHKAPSATLKELEREVIVKALRDNGWIQYKAAAALGLTPRQMGYRVRKFSLEGLLATERAKLRSR